MQPWLQIVAKTTVKDVPMTYNYSRSDTKGNPPPSPPEGIGAAETAVRRYCCSVTTIATVPQRTLYLSLSVFDDVRCQSSSYGVKGIVGDSHGMCCTANLLRATTSKAAVAN